MFTIQKLKCRFACKSVSGTYGFVKGEEYSFAVIRHNDEDYECVLKFPDNNGELVDSRMFEDYDISFIDEDYYEVRSKKSLKGKFDKKERPIVIDSVLYGGNREKCEQYLHKLSESLNELRIKHSDETELQYEQGVSLSYVDERGNVIVVQIVE